MLAHFVACSTIHLSDQAVDRQDKPDVKRHKGVTPVGIPLSGVRQEIQDFMESLILAQDERWRRA